MEYPIIMNTIWNTLNLPTKNWRQIYKVKEKPVLARPRLPAADHVPCVRVPGADAA